MSCFSSLFLCHDPPATCSIEVLPDSVFGIHDESVADSGTVNGDELQRWIPVCVGPLPLQVHRQGLSEAEASYSVYIVFLYLNWESNTCCGKHLVSSSGQTLAAGLGSRSL